MHEIVLLLQILRPVSFVAFLIALIAGIVGHRYASQQKFDVAKIFTLVSAIASTVAVASYVVFFALSLDIFAGIMCAVWVYFSWYSWSSYKRYKSL
jgi:hypothetical protein